MPSIDFSQAPAWLQWILVGTVVLGGIVGVIQFIRKGWPVLSQFVKTINALATLPAFIEDQSAFRDATNTTLATQNKTLDTIKHELFPNSGKSLRDQVDKQGVSLDEINKKLASDNTRITDLENPPTPRRRKPPTKKE